MLYLKLIDLEDLNIFQTKIYIFETNIYIFQTKITVPHVHSVQYCVHYISGSVQSVCDT